MWQVDRSRILDYQACPRRRYLAYHYRGTGIQKIAKALPLVFGSAFHEGAELMLRGEIEAAVLKAKLFLSNVFEKRRVGFDGEKPSDVGAAWMYGAEEQAAMAEALLRGFWAFEGEYLLRDFEILEVEAEGKALLTEGMELMFRPDALVREKATGDIYEISWKTFSTWGDKQHSQAKVDMQSCSEVWGRLNDKTNPMPISAIEGVLYKFCTKGSRRKDKWDGLYKQGSHLIYGWRRQQGADEAEWSWSWDFINEETGKPSTLGKGWKKVPIWREYPGGVKTWIDDLSAGRVFPRHQNPLEEAFPMGLPVSRRSDEVESWHRSIVAQEHNVQARLEDLELDGFTSESLDENFPMHTARCHDYSGCPMFEACHVPAVKADPLGSGLYQIRLANHPENGGDDE